MAFLDFIRNRQQQGAEQPQEQPETAKEMYTREASQERSSQLSAERMPESERGRAREVGERLDAAMKNTEPPSPTPTPTPDGGASSPEPQRQNMMAQGEEAPALSPTSNQRGQTEQEKGSPGPAQESSEPSPQTGQATMARRSPSWER